MIINLIVTAVLIRNTSFTNNQKLLQAVFIWLLPIFGALLIYTFAREDKRKVRPKKINNKDSQTGPPGTGTGG